MQKSGKVIKRYSLAFRQKVVSEIESGKLSIAEARKLYDINGCETIQYWIKKMGKNQLLSKVVRIEMVDEMNQLRELNRQKKELETALAQAYLKNLSLEKILEIASKEYGEDFKKKYGTKASNL